MSLFHELHALALSRAVSRKPSALRLKTDDGVVMVKPSAPAGGFTVDATRTALAKDGATVEFRGDVGEWVRSDPGIRLDAAGAVEFFNRGNVATASEPAAAGATTPAPETVPATAAQTGRAPRSRQS